VTYTRAAELYKLLNAAALLLLLSLLKLLLPRGQPSVLPPPEVDPEDQGGHKEASGPQDEAGEREGEAAHAQSLLCVELRGHLSCNTRMERITCKI
jgi:hypothetical protein